LNSDVEGEQGKRQTQLCHEALRELVLETREFAQLLGDIRNDGQRIKGAIEQRLKLIRIDNEQTFLRQITIGAAQIADENGRITDAVLLYHLAEEYDDVISVCCRAVSDATSTEPGDTPVRLEPLATSTCKPVWCASACSSTRRQLVTYGSRRPSRSSAQHDFALPLEHTHVPKGQTQQSRAHRAPARHCGSEDNDRGWPLGPRARPDLSTQSAAD